MNLGWISLPLGEWRRRPARQACTVVGVALAVGSLFALLGFERGYRESLQNQLNRLGAQILIVPKGCPYDAASLALHGANWPCYLKADYLRSVRAVSGIAAAVPVLMSAVSGGEGRPVVYVGTEATLLGLRPRWRISGRFPERGGEVLAGAAVAERFGWRTGDTVELPGLRGQRATVVGVLARTEESEDYFVHLPLEEAQRWFRRPGELTHVLVRLSNPDDLDGVVGRLRSCDAGMHLNIVPLTHLFQTIQRLAGATRSWLASVVGVGFLIAGAGVGNALLMAITERRRELGVFRALGASRWDISRLVLVEALVTCVAGGIAGLVGVVGASIPLEAWIRARLPLVPDGGLLAWDVPVVLTALAGAVVLGVASALGPAWAASRLSPTEAMRSDGES